MFAVRNIKLCTKDCICLFVCPTGATDTEDGRIDAGKCIDGCRLCVDACPSHAIYLVYERYPEKDLPEHEIVSLFARLLSSKTEMSLKAGIMAEAMGTGTWARIFKSLGLSGRVLAEDCIRESGYLIPEHGKTSNLVRSGLLQKIYHENLENPDTESLQTILDAILEALRLHRDAEMLEVLLCENCGNLSLKDIMDKCPNCGSARVTRNPG